MATTQTTSPAGLHATSDYTVTTLAIVTSDGTTIDLSSLYLEINLYEDLFSPCMSGSILMGEALDLISNFKLHGNEYLVMNIDKPGLGKPINKVFRIYKIGDRELTGSALQNYTIYFASEELILSTQHYVSKSYHGMQISDMVNDLLTNQLGVPKTKTNFMDKTDGIFNIIVPRMQPLEAIQWLATRSYSANGSLYMFYESRDGYNFVSIESLMKLPTYQTYYLRPKINTNPAENWNSINSLRIIKEFDIIESGRYGAYSASIVTFDFVNRKSVTSTITSGQLPMLNSNVPVNDSQNRFNNTLTGTPDWFLKFYATTDSDPTSNPAHPENWLHKKAARLAQLHSFKMLMTIPGDVLMSAGKIVAIDIPEAVPKMADGKQVNELRSGNFLVSAVHHIMTNDMMTTIMELVTDSMSDKLNTALNTNQGMQTVKKS